MNFKSLVLFAPFLLVAMEAGAQTGASAVPAPMCRVGYEIGTFEAEARYSFWASFSPDGAALALSSISDGKFRIEGVFETKTGRRLSVPGGLGVNAVFGGKRWLTLMESANGPARLYDWRSGREQPLPSGTRWVRFTGRYAIFATPNPGAQVVNIDDLTPLEQFAGWDSAAVSDDLGLAVAFQPTESPNGAKSEALIWDLAAGKELARVHAGKVRFLYFRDGLLIGNAGDWQKGELTIWAARTGREVARYTGNKANWLPGPGGPTIEGTGWRKFAEVAHASRPDRTIEIETSHHGSVTWISDDRIFARRGKDGVVLDRDGRTVVATIPAAYMAWPLANGLAAIWANSLVEIFDVAAPRSIVRLPGTLAANQFGRHAARYVASEASSSLDIKQMPSYLFDTEQRKIVCQTPDSTAGSNSAFAAPDGKHLVVAWTIGEKHRRVVVYTAPDVEADRTRLRELEAKSRSLSPEEKARAGKLFGEAFTLFQAGEFEAAAVGFQRGLAIDPADAFANFYLAETYTRQNKATLARQHYQWTIDLAPDSKEALLAQTRLAK